MITKKYLKDYMFIILFTFLFILIIEIILGYAWFQRKSIKSLAVFELSEYVSQKIAIYRSQNPLENMNISSSEISSLFYSNHSNILDRFKIEYENDLNEFLIHSEGSKIILLHIPRNRKPYNKDMRDYFRLLSLKYNIKLVDMADKFFLHPEERVKLLPFDSHISRFGNELVANELLSVINPIKEYRRKSSNFNSSVKTFGDLDPNMNIISTEKIKAPYRVKTNSLGFRSSLEINRKTNQKILVIGDSTTFGPYLPNHDTFPEQLNRKLKNSYVMNAGIAGYTLKQEKDLLKEKAKFFYPDIIILQVSSSDLTGYYSWKLNAFKRKGDKTKYSPSREEINFINSLKKLSRNQNK